MESEERLKSSGLKNTTRRKAILDILTESSQPISAEQIFLTLKEKNVNINLSTVYRTLESLESKELISKVNLMDDDRMLYEVNHIGHRHYMVCVTCKKIITIKRCPLKEFEKSIEEETDFNIIGHKLYLYGHCKECQS